MSSRRWPRAYGMHEVRNEYRGKTNCLIAVALVVLLGASRCAMVEPSDRISARLLGDTVVVAICELFPFNELRVHAGRERLGRVS